MDRLASIASLFLLLVSGGMDAQPYGNEWIDHSRPYYVFTVTQEGVHRIDRNALVQAGIPVGAIDPAELRIYGKEREIPLYVKGEGDGVFDSGDYIEFFAEGNDGWLDTLLYPAPEDHTNPHYSLFNDTLRYYLTWTPSGPGKRMATKNSSGYGSLQPRDWVWTEETVVFNNEYYHGPKTSYGSSSPLYEAGEGWMSSRFNKGGSRNANVPTGNVYQGSGAPDATVKAVSGGVSNASPSIAGYNHHLQVRYGGNTAVDTAFRGYQLNSFEFTLPNNALNDPVTTITHRSVNDLNVATDYQAVAYVSIDHPRGQDLDGASTLRFRVPFNASGTQSRVRFTNFGGNNAILYRLNGSQAQRITGDLSSGTFNALVPNLSNGDQADCYLTSTNAITQVSELKPVSGDGYFRDFGALDLDSAYVAVTHDKLLSAATDYVSQAHGSEFNTLIADVDELYHQFGGGVKKHSLAIRRFAEFLYDQWTTPPSYLFLIGKSIRQANESSQGARKNQTNFQNNLVPSYGYPASDHLFSTEFISGEKEPAIPTGRLSATNASEVREYRDKMLEHKTADPAEWMKKVLHFGGGSNKNEQVTFASYLRGFENTIEDTSFGGFVHTFLKSSSDPISMNVSDSVNKLISNGASILTFFGHASGNGFDQNLDHPSTYNNPGRYPLLIANACYSGDIHQPTSQSTSEQFVLYPDGGVIGFISMVKQGLASPLNFYTSNLYREIAYRRYEGSIGQQMQATIDHYFNVYGAGTKAVETCYGMTLHGDPAVKVAGKERPEFEISAPDIYFEPSEVTSEIDSFDVNVIVTNLGKAVADTVGVELIRRYPGQGDSVYQKELHGSYFRDTVTFRLPVEASIATGINSFDVSVDLPVNDIPELVDDIGNNRVQGKELFIRTNGLIPIYPYEYAIIPNNTTTLKASTGDPFAPERNYIFEIDTTDLFNSPFKRDTVISHEGGVVSWQPGGLTFTDSTVYYWRVAPQQSSNPSTKWRESSFQYIKDRRGWGQAHYFQFKNDAYEQVVYDRPGRDFDFFSGTHTLTCQVYGNANTTNEYNGTLWKKDLEIIEYGGCGTAPAIHVAVIDPSTGEAWGSYGTPPGSPTPVNEDHQFGNANNYPNCRQRVENYFIFRQGNADQMDSLVSMIQNHVPDSFYVLAYTWRYADYNQWDNDVTNLFQNMGADSVGVGQNGVPFIFFAKKGDPSSAQEVYGQSTNELITMNADIQATGNSGTITSEVFGPASTWDALYWEDHPKEDPTKDSTRIKVIGVDRQGGEQELGDFSSTLDSIPDLETYVDADQYPYLKLKAVMKDDSSRTPAQLDRWQVLYGPMPEAALDPSAGFSFHADTLQEGEQLEFSVAVRNVSEFNMDSMLMAYWIENKDRVRKYVGYARHKPLDAGDLLYDTLTFGTEDFPGNNALWVEANPVDTTTGLYDQLEQYHFNNVARLGFYSSVDKVNPILDVTFDGRHILDGDIVSAEPEIQISLKDENQYLLMDEPSDTGNFRIWLTDPNGNQERIYFKQQAEDYSMDWIPAESKENRFRIHYRPELEEDGEYTLTVQGEDKSRNASGDVRHEISFEVINRTTVTNVLNYPNPFSTRTQFVFTLTGSRVPDQFRIQIMTVSGKVVREIGKDELGPLYIGRNRTDYWWNGTDEFGDPLGNGLYLYRVIVRDDNEEVERRETAADQYFRKGFGKMYLMR